MYGPDMTRAAYRTTSARRLNGRRKSKRPTYLPQSWRSSLAAEEQDLGFADSAAMTKPDHASRAIRLEQVFPVLGG